MAKNKKEEKIVVKPVVKPGPIERNMMNEAESGGSYGVGKFKPTENVEWPQQ